MDPNEHHGAAPEPEQPADRFPAQPHGDGRPDGGSPGAGLAGEFGAELVRAIRVGLAEVSSSGHGARRPSQLSWYAFATEYARAHWPGRAAKTRDEVSDALTAVTVAMLWDLPGRPSGQLVRRALRHWAFVVPGPGQGGSSVRPGPAVVPRRVPGRSGSRDSPRGCDHAAGGFLTHMLEQAMPSADSGERPCSAGVREPPELSDRLWGMMTGEDR